MENHKIMKGRLQHFVLFWLKPELSKMEIAEFAQFFESLKAIKYLKTIDYGWAADTPIRPVTDNSFTYSLTITFDSVEDHHVYQEDQIHLDAIEKFSKFWYRVVVHDTLIA